MNECKWRLSHCVSPVIDWRPIQAVTRLLPNSSWLKDMDKQITVALH